jgi:hypothetical protein
MLRYRRMRRICAFSFLFLPLCSLFLPSSGCRRAFTNFTAISHSNAAYDDACHVLAQKPPPEPKTVNIEEKMTDSYRAIRTNVVLAWTLSWVFYVPLRPWTSLWLSRRLPLDFLMCFRRFLRIFTDFSHSYLTYYAGTAPSSLASSTSAGSSITTTATNVYMAFLLYSVAGASTLSLFCFFLEN